MQNKSSVSIKRIVALISVIVLVIVVSGFLFYISNNKTNPETSIKGVNVESKNQFSLSVDNNLIQKSYVIDFEKGKSLFDTLTSYKTKEATFLFDYSESAYGIYLTGVNGRIADMSAKEFWNIKVNGADSQVGIKDLLPLSGDKIQLILTKY
ncbi:MAG: DUF4430 domain-containing protein [bacterium]